MPSQTGFAQIPILYTGRLSSPGEEHAALAAPFAGPGAFCVVTSTPTGSTRPPESRAIVHALNAAVAPWLVELKAKFAHGQLLLEVRRSRVVRASTW